MLSGELPSELVDDRDSNKHGQMKCFQGLEGIFLETENLIHSVHEFIILTLKTIDLFPLFPYFRNPAFMWLNFWQLLVHSCSSVPELMVHQGYLTNLNHSNRRLYILSL